MCSTINYPDTTKVWNKECDYSPIIDNILENLDLNKQLQILIPGPGDGRFIDQLFQKLDSKKSQYKAILVEPNKQFNDKLKKLNKNGKNSEIKIFNETIENYLKGNVENKFDLVLLLLLLHYIPHCWFSLLNELCKRTNKNGIILIDYLVDNQNSSFVSGLDADINILLNKHSDDEKVRKWINYHLERLEKTGNFWLSNIKGTDISLALEYLNLNKNMSFMGCFNTKIMTTETTDKHLPFEWGKGEDNQIDLKPPQEKVEFKYNFYAYKKIDDKEDIYLENTMEDILIKRIEDNISALSIIADEKKGITWSLYRKYVETILPSLLFQGILSSGVISFSSPIKSFFISLGDPLDKNFPVLSNIFVAVKSNEENVLKNWKKNFFCYTKILKASLSEKWLQNNVPVVIYSKKFSEVENVSKNYFPVKVDLVEISDEGMKKCEGNELLKYINVNGDDLKINYNQKKYIWWDVIKFDVFNPVKEDDDSSKKFFKEMPKNNNFTELDLQYPVWKFLVGENNVLTFIPLISYFNKNLSEPSNTKETTYKNKSFMGIGIIGYDMHNKENIKIFFEDIRKIIKFKNLFRRMQENYLGVKWAEDSRNKSYRQAIAAIMSRNMSHNIGSHVLSGLSNNSVCVADDRVLFDYIQQRMDYIAQISTEIPEWSADSWFLSVIMRNFYKQKNLLDYIAKADGLTASYFELDEKNKIIIKVEKEEANGNTTEIKEIIPPKDEEAVLEDFQLAIPGGITGQHAFYTILENVIRNSAKHSFKKSGKKNLEITIRYEDKPENDYVEFTIYDNVTDPNKNKTIQKNGKEEKVLLHEYFNDIFQQSLIEDNGKVKKANWGMAEMRISAGFLQRKSYQTIGTGVTENDKFIEAISEQSHLGFKFKIFKPKFLLIVKTKGDNDTFNNLETKEADLKKAGIYIKNLEDALNEDRSFSFVVFSENAYDELKNIDNKQKESNSQENNQEQNSSNSIATLSIDIKDKFPPRMMLYKGNCQNKGTTPVQTNENAQQQNDLPKIDTIELDNDGSGNYTTLKTAIYEKWLNSLLERKKLGNIKLEVITTGDSSSYSDMLINKYIYENLEHIFLTIFDSKEKENLPTDIKELIKVLKENVKDKKPEESQGEKPKEIGYILKGDKGIILKEEGTSNVITKEKNKSILLKNICVVLQRFLDYHYGRDGRERFNNYISLLKKEFFKYEEDIETLPKIFKHHIDKSKSDKNNKEKGWEYDFIIKPKDNSLSNEIKNPNDNSPSNEKVVGKNDKKDIKIIYQRHHEEPDAYYSEPLSGAQSFFNILKMYESKVDGEKEMFNLSLIENGILNIGIVDERFNNYITERGYQQKYERLRIYDLYENIKNLFTDKDKQESTTNSEANTMTEITADKFIEKLQLENYKLDCLIIHQGVLDKTGFRERNKSEKLINKLKGKIPYVYVTSGRGEPENVPKNARYINFSQIDSLIIKDYPEKILLVDSLFKSYLGKESKNG